MRISGCHCLPFYGQLEHREAPLHFFIFALNDTVTHFLYDASIENATSHVTCKPLAPASAPERAHIKASGGQHIPVSWYAFIAHRTAVVTYKTLRTCDRVSPNPCGKHRPQKVSVIGNWESREKHAGSRQRKGWYRTQSQYGHVVLGTASSGLLSSEYCPRPRLVPRLLLCPPGVCRVTLTIVRIVGVLGLVDPVHSLVHEFKVRRGQDSPAVAHHTRTLRLGHSVKPCCLL